MEIGSGGIRIAMRPDCGDGEFYKSAAAAFVRILLILGMALLIKAWFPCVDVPTWQVLALSLGISVALRLIGGAKVGKWLLVGVLVLLASLGVIFHSRVLGGIGCLANDFLENLTALTGRIYLAFSIADDAFVMWGVLSVIAVWEVLVHLAMRSGKCIFVFPLLLGVYGAVLCGVCKVDLGAALIGLGGVLLLCCRSAPGGRGFAGLPTWLSLAAMCAILCFGVAALSEDSDGMREQWARTLHTRLYDEPSNSMPEGQLANLGAWDKSDTPALSVTMSAPQKLYLRGCVYETYASDSWSTLSAQKRAEYEDLFYWLHRADFYAQSQIGTATAFTTLSDAETLTIENLSACAAHGYYPYALAASDWLDASRIGDDDFPTCSIVRYYPGSVAQWYTLQQTLSSAQERGNISEYLAAEEGYREYVYDVDLQMTSESWAVLNRLFDGADEPMTLSQILDLIRSTLDGVLTYDETIVTRNGSADFLQYTLEGSASGYSVHYATAATLMLRYFGVPARYVEGYYLSGAEAAAVEADQPILLTENHAHAWAEYYLPGVGFVPFEVTPGYIDEEELLLGGDDASDSQMYSSDHLKYAQVDQPERIEEPQQARISFSVSPEFFLYLLLAALLALGICVFVRRRRFQKALRAMDAMKNREAIAAKFGYAVELLQTLPDAAFVADSAAEERNREALFSNHEMSSQARCEMDAYVACVLAACKENWNLFQKIRYRFWDCLY